MMTLGNSNFGLSALSPMGNGDVQKSRSSKAAAYLASGAYIMIREHDKLARTPLAGFFNIPEEGKLCHN